MPELDASTASNVDGFQKSFSAPIGLDPAKTSMKDLASLCAENIQQIGLMGRCKSEIDRGDTSPLVWTIFNAITKFATQRPTVSIYMFFIDNFLLIKPPLELTAPEGCIFVYHAIYDE